MTAGWRAFGKWSGLLVLGMIYFPLAWLALMSVSRNPLSGIPFPLSFEHYADLFSDPRWLAPFGASLVIATAVGIICAAAATLVGRALPRSRRPGSVVLFCILPLYFFRIVNVKQCQMRIRIVHPFGQSRNSAKTGIGKTCRKKQTCSGNILHDALLSK